MVRSGIADGTAAGVIEYLDVIVEKGRATTGAIQPLKTAFVKVLESVDGESWASVNVTKIDVDDYMTRFANLTRGVYSTKSITVYKSRVNRVLGWYSQFLSDPNGGWMPTISIRATPKKAKDKSENKAKQHQSTPSERRAGQDMSSPVHVMTENMISYPFPLSGGSLATLNLPTNLTQQDADRIAGFVRTLVVQGGKDENGL